MREYSQLTGDNRIEIYVMKQAGKEQKMIAVVPGVHPGTVSRKLSRNTGLRGYRPKQAQQKALQRDRTVQGQNFTILDFPAFCSHNANSTRIVGRASLSCRFFENIYKKLGINRADRYGIGVRISAAQARIDLDFAIEKLVEVTQEPDI